MNQFIREFPIIGKENYEKLREKKIIVFGCGGVGAACVEAIVRAGIEEITIVDNDIISESNINRQLIALHSTIGQAKVEVLKKRILDINPKCNVKTIEMFVDLNNINQISFESYDFIIDAIDTITTKIAIAQICFNNDLNLISSMGTGNRIDPTKFKIVDINKTSNDPVAKVLRYELKKRDIKKLNVLVSEEIPIKVDYKEFPELQTVHKNAPGSISFVPPVAGMIIASYVIRELLKL